MPNPFMPRPQVHAWSEEIGTRIDLHGPAIQRLVRDQRRLSRFVEENRQGMEMRDTAEVAVYLIGVVLRMFDLAGGRLRNVTWEQVHAAEALVGPRIDDLFPLDERLPVRARSTVRAQPHILDEALYALFERRPPDRAIDAPEALKIYLLLWVATEALDRNWTPPDAFVGDRTYTFTPV